jgi:predicted  nucleic acid-binding Zn-ribbon protein
MTCRRHCWVWHVEVGGVFVSGCAHCDATRHRWVTEDLAGDLDRAAAAAWEHALDCRRPARLPTLHPLTA